MDERAKYFRRLKRLRGAARRWSVMGGGLTAAALVMTPYAGIGPGDAAWAAGAGASVVLAWWRWKDHRELAATPAPPPSLPEDKLSAALQRFPAGRTVLREVRRQRNRFALRGSVIADAWERLERASHTMAGLAGRLTGVGETALLEAATAERWLRDLGQRAASVERAIPLGQSGQRDALVESHAGLAEQFSEGVEAYEQLVAAAASYVAEDGHPLAETRHPVYFSLVDAADKLRGIAEGLAELRTGDIRVPPAARSAPRPASDPFGSASDSFGTASDPFLTASDPTEPFRSASSPTEPLRSPSGPTESFRAASGPGGAAYSTSDPLSASDELRETRAGESRRPPGSRSPAAG